MKPLWTLLPLLAALTLAACGGGGSSGSDSGGGANPDPNVPGDGDGGNGGDGGDGDGGNGGPDPEPEPEPLAALRFIVIGDSGSGSSGQYAVGEAIAAVCDHKGGMDEASPAAGCHLALGLGDNIYESGVTSVDDPQFEEKFEKPFEPIQLPFYMVL
ncbi:MAG: serine/threonine protein phosphatase, partial [Alloalcanivorax xenomutans]